MAREKAIGRGYDEIHFRIDEMVNGFVADFRAGQALGWPVLPRHLVHRVWSDFVRDGYVRDERALDAIYASIRDNVVRLQIANIVAGHEGVSPESLLAEHLDPDQYEEFCSWLVDYENGWRISDYGIGPLTDAVALAFEARTAAARLKYLDRALHVTHARNDLSKLFVEGGRDTILEMEQLEEDCFV